VAFAKSQMAAGLAVPLAGIVFVSVQDLDKPAVVPIAKGLAELGFRLLATAGTHEALIEAGVESERIGKIQEGEPNNVLQRITNGEIAFIINTPSGKIPRRDERRIRATAVQHKITVVTTMTGASAMLQGVRELKDGAWSVKALQDYLAEQGTPGPEPAPAC
jgi:carbamoyl-phosphate synthase large subunit